MISASEFLMWCEVFNVEFGGGSGPITIPVPMSQGGTGANLTASAGSLFYSTASHGALLATSANGVLVTNGSGAPSISTTLPSGLTVPGYLPLGGGTMAGLLNMNSFNIANAQIGYRYVELSGDSALAITNSN